MEIIQIILKKCNERDDNLKRKNIVFFCEQSLQREAKNIFVTDVN